jgi:quinolinate synthase
MTSSSSLDDLRAKILRLKADRKAVILAHNYQVGEVQDIADFVGDSLQLSRQAAATEAEVIIFCGVHFMAETAKILSPQKTVLLPELKAGCPLANMATAEQVRRRKAELPGRPVVSYINTTAAVKAESDICCTSSNAVKVVENLPDNEILFLPDRNLGSWVAEQTGKKIILWDGFCTTHQKILPEHILPLKARHPGAQILVHPECTPEVRRIADFIGSTSGILKQARESAAKIFIIGTECGIIHTLEKENPDKIFLSPTTPAVCPNMKRIGLETVLWALEEMRYPIEVPEEVRGAAKRAIDRMLAIP